MILITGQKPSNEIDPHGKRIYTTVLYTEPLLQTTGFYCIVNRTLAVRLTAAVHKRLSGCEIDQYQLPLLPQSRARDPLRAPT